MTDEIKQEEEQTSESDSSTDENKAEDSKGGEDTLEKTSAEAQEDSIDYKAELEAEQKRREKAEEKIVKLKRQKKSTDDDDEFEDEYEAPNIKNVVQEAISEELNRFQLLQSQKLYDDAVSKVSNNLDEAELIKYHLENSVKLSGDVNIDVRRAKVLANESKLLKQIDELKVANQSRESVGSGESSSHKAGRESEALEKLTDAERAFLKKVSAIDRWKMTEGNPDSDLNLQGEITSKIISIDE